VPGANETVYEAPDGWKLSAVVTVKLPLPRFTRSPIFFLGLAALHIYLGAGHVLSLVGSAVTWTDVWKGVGAAGGAYYFLALALDRNDSAK